MTIRSMGAAIIKLIGLYHAALAVMLVFSALAYLVAPSPDGVLHGVQFAFGPTLGGWLGRAFVAALFVMRGDTIASALFPDVPLPAPNLLARDWLRVGICILGIAVAASGVGDIARAAGTALWYAGAGRQALFADAMRRLYPSPVDAGLNIVVGAVLVWQSRRLSYLLFRNDPRHDRGEAENADA